MSNIWKNLLTAGQSQDSHVYTVHEGCKKAFTSKQSLNKHPCNNHCQKKIVKREQKNHEKRFFVTQTKKMYLFFL